ncbi:MAG: hypothetical protein RL060_280 [Bacteroidota bacterium]|jgi:hypothetical protein
MKFIRKSLLGYLLVFIFPLSAQMQNVQITDSLVQQASVFKKDKQYNSALKCYLEALKLTTTEDKAYPKINLELGQLYFDWGMYDKASAYLVQATQQEHTVENLKPIKLLALSYEKNKKYEQAIVQYKILYDKCLHKSQEKANVLVAMATVYKKMGQYQHASVYEIENLALRKALKDTVGIFISLNNLGATFKYLNDKPKALDYFKQSYTLSKLAGEEIQMGLTLMNIGLMYQLMAMHPQAIQHLAMALVLLQKKQKYQETGLAYNALATSYFISKDYSNARKFAQLALDIALKEKLLEVQSISYKLLSSIYKATNMMEESYGYLQKHADIKDSMLLHKMLKEQALNQKQLDIENKETQVRNALIDSELKALQVKKINLEKDTKDKASEIEKRDQALREIANREQLLKKEKELHLLILREQAYKMEANAKQIALLHQQKILEDQNKRSKLKALNDNAKITVLQLNNQKSLLEKQAIYKKILLVVLILAPVFGFLIFRVYAYRQNALNSKLKNRTLDLEQRMLRAQMNPHFIFNAMNSIQSFVSSNDAYSAERYLARFSRLMRYILENSAKQLICLADEFNMLQLYIELEQLRFDQLFHFEITMNKEIDSEFIFIPPLLTQPYIENAIVHGLCNKKEPGGLLKINYALENDTILVCTIEDNGIGRAKAQQLALNKTEMHKSMGMQVTKERFDMLAKSKKLDFSSVITDLYHQNGEAAGTRITLRIAISEEEEPKNS